MGHLGLRPCLWAALAGCPNAPQHTVLAAQSGTSPLPDTHRCQHRVGASCRPPSQPITLLVPCPWRLQFLKRGSAINKYTEAEILNHSLLRHPHVIQFKVRVLAAAVPVATSEAAAAGVGVKQMFGSQGGLQAATLAHVSVLTLRSQLSVCEGPFQGLAPAPEHMLWRTRDGLGVWGSRSAESVCAPRPVLVHCRRCSSRRSTSASLWSTRQAAACSITCRNRGSSRCESTQ